MTISLTVSATTLELHRDLMWTDEFEWNPVEQAVERSLTGALIVDYRARLLGRPITLAPEDNQAAWMTRADVQQLRTWAATPGQQMTLTFRGAAYTVMWRHHEEPALSAQPVVGYSDLEDADWYRVTLKLMVIA